MSNHFELDITDMVVGVGEADFYDNTRHGYMECTIPFDITVEGLTDIVSRMTKYIKIFEKATIITRNHEWCCIPNVINTTLVFNFEARYKY